MKEEALKLADEFDWHKTTYEVYTWCLESQAMIRRLVEELDKQGEPVAWIEADELVELQGHRGELYGHLVFKKKVLDQMKEPYELDDPIPLYTTPQTKPLSDEEISEIWFATMETDSGGNFPYAYARAIEERHGIK